ncbi:manganese peroxidase 1 precursor [Rickenella mellea]|uniref:Peroxidase n=1 Tax=Rickenella mellea TaxID=50990 RepID=A0A4Y7PPQ9_9AGAM|nr:manganese peroxidase 1 precursor [Rickenella mellea]
MAFKSLALLVAIASVFQFTWVLATPVKKTACPNSSHSAINAACCTWFDVLDDMQANLFDGAECGEEAHSALRIAFHDAIGFSTKGGKGGGADGSIIANGDVELEFAANNGIEDIATPLQALADAHGKSYGDIIQFSAAVAVADCPGGARLQFLAGRPNATLITPDGTVPDPFNTVDVILARMADAGFSSDELIALLTSHTIAAADKIDITIPGTPFDSTPGTFDTQIFIEVLLNAIHTPGAGLQQGEVKAPLAGLMRLQSDFELSRDSRTACTWQSFANNPKLMNQKFTAAMAKLAVLGQNVRHLIDCSEVIPTPATNTVPPFLPAGKHQSDIHQACAATPFPSLPIQPGPQQSIAPVPPS